MRLGDECEVPVTAVGWHAGTAKDGQVEVELTDRHGEVHRIVDRFYLRAVVTAVDGYAITVAARYHHDDRGEPLTFDLAAATVLRVPEWSVDDVCDVPAIGVCWLCDDPQPGIVLVELIDAHGRPHQFVGKHVYFGGYDDLTPDARYPRPVTIQATVLELGDEVATVSTHWVEAQSGPFILDVRIRDLRATPEQDLA